MTSTKSASILALQFIRRAQQKNGSFVSFSSLGEAPFINEFTYRTTFTPAIILAALSEIDSEDSNMIKAGLASWLGKQKNQHWSFNYWARSAPQRKLLPYPDDLDDTFCALVGLRLLDKSIVSGEVLANAVSLLIATETKPGGPYRTWLVPKTASAAWQDVDLAVNANVAYFLSLVSKPLPNLTALMEKAITAKKFYSPYYPDQYPVFYYMARAYQGNKQSDLAEYIMSLRQADGSWVTPLRTALAVSSLIRLGADVKPGTTQAYLLKTQDRQGSWPSEAFCMDPKIQGRTYYSGSPALTTALVLEALNLSEPNLSYASQELASRQGDAGGDKIYREVITLVTNKFDSIDKDLGTNAKKILQKFTQSDLGKDVVLLPYMFYKSLDSSSKMPKLDLRKIPANSNQSEERISSVSAVNIPTGMPPSENKSSASLLNGSENYEALRKSSKDFFSVLGAANLYGWLAYTIYDDFLDDEGESQLLSCANVALRASIKHFRQALPDHKEFQQLVDESFDLIDNANSWEVTHCRFKVDGNKITFGKLPDYGDRVRLADRSIGHWLTPAAVLACQGFKLTGQNVQNLTLAFRHYLIARQLNDDLHDWQDDVKRGQVTYVVEQILRDTLDLRGGKPRQKTMDLKQLLPKMQKQFWHKTISNICQTITSHTSSSRKALSYCDALKSSNVITALLDNIDEVNTDTLNTVSDTKSFLKSYRGVK